MVTKAVHIELVEDLTTEFFFGSIKKTYGTKRQGNEVTTYIRNIYSDNGKNFVRADRILQQIFEKEDFKKAIQEFATSEKIEWHYGSL